MKIFVFLLASSSRPWQPSKWNRSHKGSDFSILAPNPIPTNRRGGSDDAKNVDDIVADDAWQALVNDESPTESAFRQYWNQEQEKYTVDKAPHTLRLVVYPDNCRQVLERHLDSLWT